MMISLEQGNVRFKYRVVGVAVREHSVLLHRAAGDDFWALPGGRAEFGETAAQTLKREMREELETEVEVVRTLWLVENFFTYAGRDYHELSVYFLMHLPPDSRYLVQPGPFQCQDAGTPLTFQWFSRQPDVLAGLPLLPSFLQTALQTLPDTLQHVVNYHKEQA
jgi:8-oxo-dGTP pyrophosphatase MutT (NUDIX family)